MTYDEFERVGLSEGLSYVFCKLAWGLQSWHDKTMDEPALRASFRHMLKALPTDCKSAMDTLSVHEFAPGALEWVAAKMVQDAKERERSNIYTCADCSQPFTLNMSDENRSKVLELMALGKLLGQPVEVVCEQCTTRMKL